MKDSYGRIYRIGKFASLRLYDRKAWPKAINRLMVGGLEIWRFPATDQTKRLETHCWPFRKAADEPIIRTNKIFLRFGGRVYALAWNSKRPMVPAMQFDRPRQPKTGNRP